MKKLVSTFVFAAFAALFTSSLALADVQSGIEAFKSAKFDIALKELRPAAENGDPNAMYYLGQMYAAGFGVKKDPAKALAYYREAAEMGYPPAQTEYGTALAIGDGVKQDVEKGLKWLLIAARTGDKSAKDYAEHFSRLMSRTVVLEATRDAIEWQHRFNKKNAAAEATPQ